MSSPASQAHQQQRQPSAHTVGLDADVAAKVLATLARDVLPRGECLAAALSVCRAGRDAILASRREDGTPLRLCLRARVGTEEDAWAAARALRSRLPEHLWVEGPRVPHVNATQGQQLEWRARGRGLLALAAWPGLERVTLTDVRLSPPPRDEDEQALLAARCPPLPSVKRLTVDGCSPVQAIGPLLMDAMPAVERLDVTAAAVRDEHGFSTTFMSLDFLGPRPRPALRELRLRDHAARVRVDEFSVEEDDARLVPNLELLQGPWHLNGGIENITAALPALRHLHLYTTCASQMGALETLTVECLVMDMLPVRWADPAAPGTLRLAPRRATQRLRCAENQRDPWYGCPEAVITVSNFAGGEVHDEDELRILQNQVEPALQARPLAGLDDPDLDVAFMGDQLHPVMTPSVGLRLRGGVTLRACKTEEGLRAALTILRWHAPHLRRLTLVGWPHGEATAHDIVGSSIFPALRLMFRGD